MRVQIPAYTDRWMMGDRYGEVIATKKGWKHDPQLPGKVIIYPVYRVKLDKSGKVVRVVADDCTEV